MINVFLYKFNFLTYNTLIMEYYNPKALNLDILEEDTTGRKVTLGFKCSPQLKLQLATEAQHKGYSLSEYVESIMETYTTQSDEIEQLNNQVTGQQASLDWYEKDKLVQELLKKHKGKTINLKGKDSRKVEKPQDIIWFIFNSFKFEIK
jgi:hypothetical protein